MHSTVNIPATHVMLIDDHVLMAEGFRELLLRILPSGSSIHIFSSVEMARESLQKREYGIMLTDLMMPGQNVIDFVTYCRKSYSDMIILFVSSVIDVGSIKACLAAGAHGYLSKAIDPREIKLALEYTHKGKKFVSSDLTGRLADSILSTENTILTNKELEVLRLIAAGNKTKKIAEILFVSPITIMSHKRNVMRKLDLHSSTELVRYAYENNLI